MSEPQTSATPRPFAGILTKLLPEEKDGGLLVPWEEEPDIERDMRPSLLLESPMHFDFDGEKGKTKPGRIDSWWRRILSMRCTQILIFVGISVGILLLYIHYLIKNMDVLFEMRAVELGFENGAIQANFTVSSQFLPGKWIDREFRQSA